MESVNESFEYAMHEVVYVYLIKRGKKLLPLYEAKKKKLQHYAMIKYCM